MPTLLCRSIALPEPPALGVFLFPKKIRRLMMLLRLGILICLLGCGTQALAANISTLSQSDTWRRLLLYEPTTGTPNGWKSAIHSPEFFLSESGPTDPEAELRATVQAMGEPPENPPDNHAKCRFPARRLWLQKQIPALNDTFAEINCPRFADWTGGGTIEAVSLVFANGYLGNPASYFGHVFVKLSRSKSGGNSNLLEPTLNFGAIVNKQDDPVSYIVKGIFGGYDGGFSPIEFYFHNTMYGENELRDLWEYRLDLPQPAVDFIVAHAWEVLNKRYSYYFFYRNCAYRVAELLEIVEGLELTPRNRPWVIPQALIQKIPGLKSNEGAIGARTLFYPSRQTRLYTRYSALDVKEQKVVHAAIDRNGQAIEEQTETLPINQRHTVIDTVLDYYQFAAHQSNPANTNTMPSGYITALALRLKLPPGGSSEILEPLGSPLNGRSPSWAQIGISQIRSGAQSLDLRIRPAYYDWLDAGIGQHAHGLLKMGDIALTISENRLRIRRLDLLAIESMDPAITNLPGDRGYLWKLRLGAEQERVSCDNCLAARIQGDVGIGRQFDTRTSAALFIGGAAQPTSTIDGAGFVRIGLNVRAKPSEDIGVRITHELRKPFFAPARSYSSTGVEARLRLDLNWDLRLSLDHDDKSRISLGLGHYW